VVPFENAEQAVRRKTRFKREFHVLVMRIPNPRERTCNADCDCEVGDDSHYEYSIMVILVVNENEGHPEDEPCKAGRCAARMYAAQVLKGRRATKAEP
jgi:hypothetical protein